ncbi:hypothetical protein PMAYCL1PPCAC_07823, partial [Pristionchus mayeri]
DEDESKKRREEEKKRRWMERLIDEAEKDEKEAQKELERKLQWIRPIEHKRRMEQQKEESERRLRRSHIKQLKEELREEEEGLQKLEEECELSDGFLAADRMMVERARETAVSKRKTRMKRSRESHPVSPILSNLPHLFHLDSS